VGLVTTTLDHLDVSLDRCVAVACGPPVMMKFVTFKLIAELKLPPASLYLSMEKNMSCGIGKCGHCRLGPYFVCQDGPVLTYDKIKDIPGIWH
jgi:NAD(P)H-flavin reductase